MFTLYTAALFLHIVGALGLFAGFTIEWVALISLRKTSEIQIVKHWLGIYSGIGRIAGPSGILLLLSGFYLSITIWGFPAWIHLTFSLIIIMLLIGIFMSGRVIMVLGKQIGQLDTFSSDLKERLNSKRFLHSITLRTAIALEIVLLMTMKPELAESLISFVVVVGIAWVLAYLKKK